MRQRTQRGHFYRYVSLILIGILMPVPAAVAGPDPSPPTCLAEAEARLRTNEWIRLTMRDGRKLEGYLTGIDSVERTLSLANARELDAVVERFDRPELLSIQYRRRGTFNPLCITFGLFGGMAVGAIVGSFSQRETNTQMGSLDPGPIGEGVIVGGLAGLVLGIFVPPLIPWTKTIECE